jgi:hypothetical protein
MTMDSSWKDEIPDPKALQDLKQIEQYANSAGTSALWRLAETLKLTDAETDRLGELLYIYGPDDYNEVADYVLGSETQAEKLDALTDSLREIHKEMERRVYEQPPFMDPMRIIAALIVAEARRTSTGG